MNNPFAEVTKNNTINNTFTRATNPFAEVVKNNSINNKVPGVLNLLNELQKNSKNYSDLLSKETEDENKNRSK